MSLPQPGAELARLRLRLALVGGWLRRCCCSSFRCRSRPSRRRWSGCRNRRRCGPRSTASSPSCPSLDGAQVAPGDLLAQARQPRAAGQPRAACQPARGAAGRAVPADAARSRTRRRTSRSKIDRLQAEIDRARPAHRAAERAGRAARGRLAMPRQADLIGSYVRQGKTIGHVLAGRRLCGSAPRSPRTTPSWCATAFASAEVRLADAPGQVLPASRSGDMPAAPISCRARH